MNKCISITVLRHSFFLSALRSPFAVGRMFGNSTSHSRGAFRIVEVGPRDGLQNEKQLVPTSTKVELIDRLSACGLKTIEATSFVSPKWIPQMADNNDVLNAIQKYTDTYYPVLVPNMAGLQNALKNPNVKEIAVFGAASESFTRKNTNCSMAESLQRLKEVTEAAIAKNLRVRGYISMVIADPDEGPTDPKVTANIVQKLLSFGCYEVSLGDTIGVGSARSVNLLLDEVLKVAPAEKLAVHFHDTYGQALANVLVAIERGIRVADSSVSGLGGCPYAKGATGNLATEDLLYLLDDLGFDTGVNLDRLIDTGSWICQKMQRPNSSRVARAIMSKRFKEERRMG
ncbi:3-hydroxymethyl-3-methylglutaryl-CoA lyase, cytoplasmic [Aphelenchoides besseyi]|nr:3-hydroxymethyl-3-methylglutaryl-CoA lyase, cytoplasmic [Aphelenchoides besseyi]KAI6193708.1 3-hydroxymethyl-3-methylglutaryl-CoA lyase, cytoplasmic [Aphelenchoides besseyi]